MISAETVGNYPDDIHYVKTLPVMLPLSECITGKRTLEGIGPVKDILPCAYKGKYPWADSNRRHSV